MNKKVSIIIVGVLLVFFIIVLALFKNNANTDDTNKKNEKEYSYLVINNESIWGYNDNWIKSNRWVINNTSLETYIDNVYSGFYTYKMGNVWNLFNGDNYVSYDGLLIGFTKNLGILRNINRSDLNGNDLNNINSILNIGVGIDDILYYDKVNIDLDNNGVIDSIVYVTNITDESLSNYFSLLYVVLNGDVLVLKNDKINDSNYYEVPIYKIKSVINIDNKNIDNIIIEKGFYSDVNKTGNIMYEYSNNKYTIVVED